MNQSIYDPCESVDEMLQRGIQALKKNGVDMTPAWQRCKCVQYPTPVVLTLKNPLARFCTMKSRKQNIALTVAESLWIASGMNDLDELPGHYAKAIYNYADNGKSYRAGYGPRIRFYNETKAQYYVRHQERTAYLSRGVGYTDQLRFCIEQLKKDKFTRQAVITIHDPNKDDFDLNGNLIKTKDTPCLAGDTLVFTPEGKKEISSLKKGDYVFNYDEDNEKIVINKILWAGKTDTVKQYLKITLSTGEIIRITPNHKCFTNEYSHVGPARQLYIITIKAAEELKAGDYILSTVVDYSSGKFKEFLRKNTAYTNMKRIYTSYYETYHKVSLKDGEVIHHKNGNHSDNSIENLEVLSESEHNSHHRLIDNPIELLAAYPEITPKKERKSHTSVPNFVKILKIEEVTEDLDVYNLTVDGFHNYIIDGGWIVKNCTRSVQFMCDSEGKLNCYVQMRSNDILHGMSVINVAEFTFLQQIVAQICGLPLGQYYHIANSFHFYEDTKEMIDACGKEKIEPIAEMKSFSYAQEQIELKDFDKAIDIMLAYEAQLVRGEDLTAKNPFFVDRRLQVFSDYAEVFRLAQCKKHKVDPVNGEFFHPQLQVLYQKGML